MKPLWDGFFILLDQWQLVLGVLGLMLVSQCLVYWLIKSIFGQSLSEEEYYSLGIAGWLLPASFLSLLWYLSGALGLPTFSVGPSLIVISILAVLLLVRVNRQTIRSSKTALVSLLFLLVISIPLRLTFLSDLLMPQYFDSVRHYTLIQSLLTYSQPATFPFIHEMGANYYHLGFHFLAAFAASILQADTASTMLVLGQMILTAAPLSIFFLIKHETQSNRAGIFAVLLAGIGWTMPAYAVNWGKYPAVASLALMPFPLSIAYLVARRRKTLTVQKKWTLYALFGTGVLICGFFHSRAFVVIGIGIVAWLVAGAWQNLRRLPRALVLCMLFLGIIFEIILSQRQEVLELLFNPYGVKGLVVTIVVAFLAVFAHKTSPRMAFANILGIFLLLCSLFVPTLNLIPRLAGLTLLDRIFVEMILYLPLSFLGGLGLAGLEQTLRDMLTTWITLPPLRQEYVGSLFIALLLGVGLLRYDFYASDCCTIIGQDDLTVMEWVKQNVPPQARILISANALMVQSSGLLQGYAAADAGGWITPLTGRVTIPMLYDTNLGKEKKFKSLCKMGVDYIYIGAVGLSFYAPRLRAHPDWYKPSFSLSRAEVYQVIGCH